MPSQTEREFWELNTEVLRRAKASLEALTAEKNRRASLKADQSRAEEERRILQSNFSAFVRSAWHVLHPFDELIDGPYIDALAEWAQAVHQGRIRRSIINQPPRTLKSTIFSVMFPCWVWTTNPSRKFIFYSWSFDKLSVPLSVERRRLLQSQWYQQRWANVFTLSYDEQMKWMFSNDKTGRMTVLTGATGIGGNFLIIDDPHNTEEAESDAERQACIRKVRNGLLTRLDNPSSDSILIVMQRLHWADVSGVLLKDGGWSHLCLPAKAEKKATVKLAISGKEWHRAVGDLLDPIRLPDKILEEKKIEIGTRGYYGQFQQEPSPPGGTIFASSWWRWYSRPPEFEEIAISVDATFKGKETSDDVAVQAWGMVGVQSYLVARDTRKMGFAATKASIRAMVERTGASIVLIEDKANGSAIIEELKSEFFVIAINPDFGDKVARAEGCSPMVEAGTVFLPENEDGVKLQTLASRFPNSDKDDIDAMTQFLNWRRKRGATMEWFKSLAKKAEAESGQAPEQKRIEHPTQKEVHRIAMEQAGMKNVKPQMSKQVKAGDLKKDAPTITACPECGSTSLFKGRDGAKCLKCGAIMLNPSREVNIG